MYWRRVGVVKPEAIGNARHILYILSHMLPELRRVSRACAVPKLDVVSPDIDVPPEIVPSVHSEVLHAVPTTDPAVVGDFRSLGIVKL